jgi:hypothetical protein
MKFIGIIKRIVISIFILIQEIEAFDLELTCWFFEHYYSGSTT